MTDTGPKGSSAALEPRAEPPASTERLHDDRGLSAQDVLNSLRGHWKAVALLVVLGVLTALGLSLAQTRVYESTTAGVVMARVESDAVSALAGHNLAKSKVVSFQDLAESKAVAERAIAEIGLDTAPEELLPHIDATVAKDTVQLEVTATAETAEEAVKLAEGWMNALAEEVSALETASQATANTPAAIVIHPLSNASVPQGPTSPELDRNLILGGLAGLIVGSAYAFLRYRADH